MKRLRLIISMVGLFVTTSWGSDSRQLVEGALGEAESSASFFKREIDAKIIVLENAITAFKDFCANPNQTLPNKYLGITALKDLESTAQTLQKLLGFLEESKSSADRFRILLDTLPESHE